jgi:hypothetical protein
MYRTRQIRIRKGHKLWGYGVDLCGQRKALPEVPGDKEPAEPWDVHRRVRCKAEGSADQTGA